MKSSKFTQVSSTILNPSNDNDFADYENVGVTIISDDGNQNVSQVQFKDCPNVNHSSSELLLNSSKTPELLQEMHHERNSNRFQRQPMQDIELLCHCVVKEPIVYPLKTRFGDHQCHSEQNAVLNRSFTSLPKMASTNLSQISLDRKGPKFNTMRQHKQHAYICDQNQRVLREMEKNATLRRMQSPEIINLHRGPNFYDGTFSAEQNNCAMKMGTFDKCDDYGFRRGHSVRATSSSRFVYCFYFRFFGTGTSRIQWPYSDSSDSHIQLYV